MPDNAFGILDGTVVLAFVVLLFLLLRAAHVLGADSDQQIREQEKLAGPFPSGTTREQKLRWMNIFGSVGVSSPGRVWILAIGTALCFLWLMIRTI